VLPLAIADLVTSGFAVSEVASATSVAADACGLAGTTGRLQPGLEADLLVVEGDLEHDIDVLRRPVRVRRAGVEALSSA
jgi:imidazolonepropionase-like amidohydrolase